MLLPLFLWARSLKQKQKEKIKLQTVKEITFDVTFMITTISNFRQLLFSE